MIKYRGVVTHYGNHQVTPFFSTVAEVEKWEKENNVESDAIMPVRNWKEVQEWQQNPEYKHHYRPQGAWQVMS